MEHITSPQNPALKLARKLLQSSRERQRSSKILLDGAHLIGAYAARFGLPGATIIVDQDATTRSAEIGSLIDAASTDARVVGVPAKLFATISPVETPSGVVAICEQPEVRAIGGQFPFQLLLDGIQNPGNLGSILRTAAATGVTQVLLSPNCADPWSPKCLRGGMGAQFVLPAVVTPDPRISLRGFQGKRIATSSHQGNSLMGMDLSGPLLVLFGGEGAGLPADLTSDADLLVRIPLENDIESLNVAAAVAMFCYERMRQTRI